MRSDSGYLGFTMRVDFEKNIIDKEFREPGGGITRRFNWKINYGVIYNP